jgi:serralysin
MTSDMGLVRSAPMFVFSGMLSIALGSCSRPPADREIVEVEHQGIGTISWDQYREQAVREVIDGKTVYEIDGDEMTDSVDVLREYYDSMMSSTASDEKLHLFQRLSTGFEPTFVGGAAQNIRYCVSDQFVNFSPFSKTPIITAMATATAAWQSVANVQFFYLSAFDSACTDATSGVDFAVVPSTDPNYSGCAANKMMWVAPAGGTGCPVSGPFSSSSAFGVLAVNLPLKQSFMSTNGLLMHELGHIMGFRHEHPFGPNGCGGEPQTSPANQFDIGFRDLNGTPGNPSYDQPSVMHYPGKCGKPNMDYSLSILDGVGCRVVYGMPGSWYVPIVFATL